MAIQQEPLGPQPDFTRMRDSAQDLGEQLQRCQNLTAIQGGDNIIAPIHQQTQQLMQQITQQINGLEQRVNARFDQIDQRFAQIDQRFATR